MEQQWEENVLTVQGNIIHENAHDSGFHEKRGDLLITRAMPIKSRTLGLTGECDVDEFHKDDEGIELFGRNGKFNAMPIDYNYVHKPSSKQNNSREKKRRSILQTRTT